MKGQNGLGQWTVSLAFAGAAFVALGIVLLFAGGLPDKKAFDPLTLVQLGVGLFVAWLINVAISRRSELERTERELIRNSIKSCVASLDDAEKIFDSLVDQKRADLTELHPGLRRLRGKLRETRDFCEICTLQVAQRRADELLGKGVERLREATTEFPPRDLGPSGRASAEQTFAACRRALLELLIEVTREQAGRKKAKARPEVS